MLPPKVKNFLKLTIYHQQWMLYVDFFDTYRNFLNTKDYYR